MAEEVTRGWCGPCHIRCGLLVHFKDGKAVKVEGDPNHPVNRGAMCGRGSLILEHLYHPDRVNFPVKRVGKKGEGKWKRISWDQALDEIASKISRLERRPEPRLFRSAVAHTERTCGLANASSTSSAHQT